MQQILASMVLKKEEVPGHPQNSFHRWNQWVILTGFQPGILLDLIFRRSPEEALELSAEGILFLLSKTYMLYLAHWARKRS